MPRRALLAPFFVAALLNEAVAQTGEPSALTLKGAAGIESPAMAAAPVPYHVEADRLKGQRDGPIAAQGDVRIRRAEAQITADWVRYDPASDTLEAGDRVVYSRGRDRIEGSQLKLRLAERLGQVDSVRYTLYDEAGRLARGEAGVIHFKGRDRYQLDAATYTTCPAGQEDWVLKTQELNLDYTRSLGNARQVQVRFLDTPILYAPWLDFSLDDRRKSGFLTPSFGVSDQRGLEFATPWYWNIAPARDATLYPRFMSRRGLQLGGEYRYLSRQYRGELGVELLPDDRVADRTRYRGLIRHAQQFDPRWSGSLHYER
ncbi:MAG: LPS-assembly protein LptD, partial [Thiobacillaceae bacterium]